MNSDQLLNALTDCAQASTHEPDAETINAAIARIRELEAQLAAAESALKKIRSINDQNGVIMTGSVRDAIQDVTEQYFAQGK